MNVLIACEESQRVCIEFRKRGHTAYSCDIIDCSGNHPEWHIKANCLPIIGGGCKFNTVDGKEHSIDGLWDLIIAHPPCTYLTVSGNKWFNENQYGINAISRYINRIDAINFFMNFVFCSAKKIAIENPVGIMSGVYRKPDQIIEPYEFGDPVAKKTCLWLKNLPKLVPTDMVTHTKNSKGMSGPAMFVRGDDGKILRWNDPQTSVIRSKTYPGIARAFAEQWG